MKHSPVTSSDAVEFSQLARKLRFFASMKVGLMERILNGMNVFEFARGEKVCTQGEPGDFFFIVHKGELEVSVRKGTFSLGKKVATLGPGDCFGEMALLHEAPRNATVTCKTKSRVFALSAGHFQAVLAQNPDFSQSIQDLSATRQFELDHRYS